MIKIIISAKDYDDNNKESILRVTIDVISSLIVFDNYNNEYTFPTQKLDELIVEYTDNYSSGVSIQMRDLYNLLDLSNKNDVNRDLARIFIISTRWMHFGQLPNFNNQEIFMNTIKKGIDKFTNDINILEWSGDMGNQPGIYFIKKKYASQYKDAIDKFYNLGLLYKYSLEVDNEKYDNFLFPFTENYETHIRKLNLFPFFNIWNKIIKDRNDDIINLVNGTRNKC